MFRKKPRPSNSPLRPNIIHGSKSAPDLKIRTHGHYAHTAKSTEPNSPLTTSSILSEESSGHSADIVTTSSPLLPNPIQPRTLQSNSLELLEKLYEARPVLAAWFTKDTGGNLAGTAAWEYEPDSDWQTMEAYDNQPKRRYCELYESAAEIVYFSGEHISMAAPKPSIPEALPAR